MVSSSVSSSFCVFSLFFFRYDGRLSYKDLNDVSLLNGVETAVLKDLWTPQLAFTNALGPYQVHGLRLYGRFLEGPTIHNLPIHLMIVSSTN
jgi:hypothetical protein